jgi:hypothetical protein
MEWLWIILVIFLISGMILAFGLYWNNQLEKVKNNPPKEHTDLFKFNDKILSFLQSFIIKYSYFAIALVAINAIGFIALIVWLIINAIH